MKKSKIFRYVLLILCLFSLLVGCTRTVYVPLPPSPPVEDADEGFTYTRSMGAQNRNTFKYFSMGIKSEKTTVAKDSVKLDCYYWATDTLIDRQNIFALEYLATNEPDWEDNYAKSKNDVPAMENIDFATVCYYVADKDFYENELEGMKLSKIKQYPQEESPYLLLDQINAYDLIHEEYFGHNFEKTDRAKKIEITLPPRLFTKEKGELIFYVNPLSDEDTKRDRAEIMVLAYEQNSGSITFFPDDSPIKGPTVPISPTKQGAASYLTANVEELPVDLREGNWEFVFSYYRHHQNRLSPKALVTYRNVFPEGLEGITLERVNLIKQVRCIAVLSTKECYENTLQKQKTWSFDGEVTYANRGFDVSVLDNADETSPFVIVGEIPMRDIVEGNEIYVKEVTVPSHLLAQSEGELVFSCEFYFDVDEFFSDRYLLPCWYNLQEVAVKYQIEKVLPMRNVYCAIAYQKQADGTIVFTYRQTI